MLLLRIAVPPMELLASGGSDLSSPALDGSGALFVASRGDGTILARDGTV